MTEQDDWRFPEDRSLVPCGAGRLRLALRHPCDAGWVDSRKIGFAALFVFARLVQQESLWVRLGEASVLAVEISPEATLEAAFAGCGDAVPASGGRIGLVISAPVAVDAPALSFAEDGAELALTLDFDASLLAGGSAQDFLEKLYLVLDALRERPQTRCGDLALVTPTARGMMPDLSRAIVAERYAIVPVTFFAVAEAHADAPAVTDGTRSYSYGELARVVRHLAARLEEAGIAAGDVVAISGFASFGVYASMLAVMAAGGVMVVLDQALPEARRELIARISRPRLRIEVGPAGQRVDAGVVVATDWPDAAEIAALPDAPARVAALAMDAPAYVFFTSGSSGVPKGVLGAHLGLAHFLAWQREKFPFGPGDRMAQLIALSFDPVLRDVLYPLTSGACLHVPAREMLFDARRMLGWFEAQGISAMHCVPSLMKAWLQANPAGRPFAAMRHAFFNGEPLTDTLLHRFAAAAGPGTQMINLYGPTETTLAKLSHVITRIEPGVQPIGTAQPGVDVAIIRDRVERCGLWEIGEIAIRTPYRSLGYLDNPELTAQAFVANPERDDALGDDPGDLIYFTGDLGRVRSDGMVEIFGRSDSQIKIHGVRIEPNEIESGMLALPGVMDAAVTLRAGADEEKMLLGLVVVETMPDEAARGAFVQGIREALRRRLSDAMVPSRIVLCASLPYLPNGKLDRKAIAALDLELPPAPRADRGGMEDARMARLVAGIEAALGRRVDTLDASFLDLGGDSLSYIRASMLIQDLLGWLPLRWEQKPLSEFLVLLQDGERRSVPRGWGRHGAGMETSLLLRAVSIVLVVMNHSAFSPSLTATSTLFVISGMNFSRFLRPAIRAAGNLRPTFSLILRFGIPAGLWQVPRSLWMQAWWLPNLFLLGTFFQNPDRPLFSPWFLDVLAANLVLLGGIGWVEHRLRGGRDADAGRNSFAGDFGWVLVGLAVAAAQVLSGWWDGEVGADSVAPFKWFWMLAFGVLITQADSTARKVKVTLLLAGLAGAVYGGGARVSAVLEWIDVFFFATVALLAWVERVPVPRLLHRPVMVVASATLFIYIVNSSVITHVMPLLRLPAWWPLEVGLSLAVGIVAKWVWDRVSAGVERVLGGHGGRPARL